MEGKQRIAFLFVVFFFCGAIVLIAAHDLKNRAMRGGGSREGAKKLIRELRGDHLSSTKDTVVNPEGVPTRTPGSYLPENDRKKLNSILKQVLPAPE